MRILALVEAPGHVCYRYRIQAFEPALRAAGHEVEVVPQPHSLGDWARLLRRASASDVVVLQRKLLAPWHLWALRRAAPRLVYDIDDAVFFRDSNSPKDPRPGRRRRRFLATVRRADVVLAGNRFLVEQATACATAADVVWTPTCVDPRKYEVAEHRADGRLAMVWIGSRSTLTSLTEAEPCLTAVASRVSECELRVVCNVFPTLERVRVVPCEWSATTESLELARADVGVSWLPDHPWSLGKCGLKVLQYMAAGLPVVANPIGAHLEIVEHGRSGFLVQTPDEWATAVARLAASPQLRRDMGRRGRELVECKYGIASRAAHFIAALTGTTATGAPVIGDVDPPSVETRRVA